jgi:hypothetical protein
MATLEFQVPDSGKSISMDNFSLIIAGFTGSNTEKVKEHLHELEMQGIKVPKDVPSFYKIPSENAVQSDSITVVSRDTSGEIEPVLIIDHGSYYLTLGSDHTDREIEKKSIARSKSSCNKPLAGTAVPLEEIAIEWDNLILGSEVLEDGKWVPYQDGRCADLTHPLKLTGLLQKAQGKVPPNAIIFLGTIPIIGGKFRCSSGFRGHILSPDSGFRISLEYRINGV